jgi:hypothetical protein
MGLRLEDCTVFGNIIAVIIVHVDLFLFELGLHRHTERSKNDLYNIFPQIFQGYRFTVRAWAIRGDCQYVQKVCGAIRDHVLDDVHNILCFRKYRYDVVGRWYQHSLQANELLDASLVLLDEL